MCPRFGLATAAALAFATATPYAHADVRATAQLTVLQIQLVDLDLRDGVAPSLLMTTPSSRWRSSPTRPSKAAEASFDLLDNGFTLSPHTRMIVFAGIGAEAFSTVSGVDEYAAAGAAIEIQDLGGTQQGRRAILDVGRDGSGMGEFNVRLDATFDNPSAIDMEGTIVAYAWAVAGSPFVPVPEPPSLLLMLTGSIWVAVFVKQRGRRLRTRRGGGHCRGVSARPYVIPTIAQVSRSRHRGIVRGAPEPGAPGRA